MFEADGFEDFFHNGRVYLSRKVHISDRAYSMLSVVVGITNTPEAHVARAIIERNTDEHMNYLDYEEGKFVYSPAKKVDHEATFDASGRQRGKVGRVARKLIHPSLLPIVTDAAIEAFTNRFLAQDVEFGHTWEVVRGDDIAYWYHENQYDTGCGSLNHSCMRLGERNHFFGIYTQNPNQVGLLTLRNTTSNKLVGRALLWETNQGTLLDRIYGSDITISAFKRYAREQGWLLAPVNGGAFHEPYRVQLAAWDFDTYPYCDTMFYLNGSTGVLSSNRQHYEDWTLTSMSGIAEGRPTFYCTDCATRLRQVDFRAENGNILCSGCFHAGQCAGCEAVVGPLSLYNAIEGLLFCPSCALARRCATCSDIMANESDLEDGECSPCRFEHRCRECRDLLPRASFARVAGTCERCHEETEQPQLEVWEQPLPTAAPILRDNPF